MSGTPRRPQAGRNIALGVLLLARGRARGLDQFGNTVQGFLASLAPLIAFSLVEAVLILLQGAVVPALTDFLVTMCAILAPPVLSHALARRWERETDWLRFATAFGWCQWVPLVAVAVMLAMAMAVGVGLPEQAGRGALLAVVALYALWLNWFVARHGLRLSPLRAAALVLLVNLGTAALVAGPQVAQLLLARGGLRG